MQENQVDPALLEFLDAEEPKEKLEVLSRIAEVLSDRSLTSIEMSLGMEPQKDEPDSRIRRIRYVLETKEKYERGRR
ncbi:MAG: hypothetical protein IKO11_01975 [Lachnospiraceae bacterium]|nr:hypothetical protein [Lachnospiraceae bacterium]